MICFDTFHLEDGVPIYQQILRYVKRGIAAGTILDGDALPSRRVLSALLGVNPNTVQKAYRMLEEEGLVTSRTGTKSCIVLGEDTLANIRSELLEENARAVVDAMKQMGISKSEALALIETYWE